MTKNTLLLLNNLNLIWVRFYFDERRRQKSEHLFKNWWNNVVLLQK